MTRQSMDTDERYMEVQMDGKQVVIVIVGVLLLCAISFYFGRRVGRAEAAGVADPAMSFTGTSPDAVEEENAAADLTFFDTVGDGPRPATAAPPSRDTLPRPQEAVETRAPADPGPSARALSAGAGEVEVQVGVYSTRAAAERLAGKLRSKGYRLAITPTRREGKMVYRVRVGGYTTRAAAQSAAKRLQEEENLATWIPPQGG